MARRRPFCGARWRGGWRRGLPLLAAALALAACGGGRLSEAPRELVGLRSNDGLRFQAELRGAGDAWVLLGHQFTGQRSDWEPIASGFVQRGYRVLSWDFRCHGDSGCRREALRDATQDIWREWEAALDFARAEGARTIHAGGASMGGTSLIQVAAGRTDIASIFAISSPNRFQGLDALADYARVTVPKLFIVGAGDGAAPDFSRRYHKDAVGPSRLEVLDTDLHGAALAVDEKWGPVVQGFLYGFVADPGGFTAADRGSRRPRAASPRRVRTGVPQTQAAGSLGAALSPCATRARSGLSASPGRSGRGSC